MKAGELIKLLQRVPEEFEVVLTETTELPTSEVEKLSYPYPFVHTFYKVDGERDIGYSDKIINIDITEDNS
ncbi:MAG: hypothetical protein GY941_22520 [Planctomycetes bacterium]|nr:hypothetical protein [Planctomycetota bacterium]